MQKIYNRLFQSKSKIECDNVKEILHHFLSSNRNYCNEITTFLIDLDLSILFKSLSGFSNLIVISLGRWHEIECGSKITCNLSFI